MPPILKPPPSLQPWTPDFSRTPVAVLMSGGVDSSVTACLLRDQGYDVVGITMLVPSACGMASACCGAHAADVCAELGLPHYLYDTTDLFDRVVIDRFRTAYAAGETPSPCIDCNTALKFGAVANAVQEHFGIRKLATGHYARIQRGSWCPELNCPNPDPEPDSVFLARAVDHAKDQSYFLYGVSLSLLPHLHLPLGDLTKTKVRALARAHGLHVADRVESMDLCFAGEGDYRAALEEMAATAPGEIVLAADSRVLGTHAGIANFTPGQRHGLGIAWTEPLYVLRIDAVTRRVVVGTREQTFRDTVAVRAVHVLLPKCHRVGAGLGGKTRSGGDPAPCRIEAIDGDTMTVVFAEPVFAPAPGQHLVLYDRQDRIVSGGVIDRCPDRPADSPASPLPFQITKSSRYPPRPARR